MFILWLGIPFVILFSSLQQTILTVQHQHMATKIHRCSATQTCHLVVSLVSALRYQWACSPHQAMLLGVTYLLAGPHPFLLHLSPVVEMLCPKRSQQTTRWCQGLGAWILMRACWKVGVRYITICLLLTDMLFFFNFISVCTRRIKVLLLFLIYVLLAMPSSVPRLQFPKWSTSTLCYKYKIRKQVIVYL